MRRVLLLPIAALGVAAAAYFALGSEPEAPPVEPDHGQIAEPAAGPRAAEPHAAELSAEREELERLAVEMGVPELADEDDENGAALVVRGRVIAKDQAPIAGAKVKVRVRRNVRAIFEGGGRPGREDMDWQSMFRQRDFGKELVTGADGIFRFAGRTFARGAGVEIAVTHDDYAPSVSNVEWQPDAGELGVPDIVLGSGALVTGLVTGPFGGPVADAVVRIELQAQDGRGPEAGPGGAGFGGNGFGGNGPGAGRGGRGGRGPDAEGLRALLPEVKTDASGRFAFTHVPSGSAVFLATAPRHTDGRSERTALEDGLRVDVGEVKLGPGAELAGMVVDEAGEPIANATVTASLFRQDGADAGPRGRGDNGGGRRGRGNAGDNAPPGDPRNVNAPQSSAPADNGRGPRGGPATPAGFQDFFRGGGRANSTTRTDKHGRFVLDRVPAAELTISVRHDQFIDATLEPIDPRQQPRVEIRMTRRPALVGTVVDAATGEPIELFGIRWRRDPSDDLRRGAQMIGGRMQEMLADPDRAEEAQRFQEMATQVEAQLRRLQDDRRARLGGAGIVPGQTPKPSTHAKGAFRLDDLEPGSIVLDIDAPGYVKVAAGPFQIGTEAAPAPLVVRVERGAVLRGKVIASHSSAAVPGARITLSLPTPPDANVGALVGMMRGQGRGPGNGQGGGPFGARGMGRETLAQVRADREGRFEFPALRPGSYSVEIRAEGFPEYRLDELMLGTTEQETILRIDPGAALNGRVIGLEPGTRATLEFAHVENRDRRTVRVDAETHEYSVAGLTAGGWTIQIVGEGDRGSFRQRLGAMLGNANGSTPDIVLAPADDRRHDIDASSAQPAVVEGQVYRNGAPGSGLEVRLALETPEGTEPSAQDFGFGRGGRGGGRMLRAQVSETDGSFRIDSVPAGAYRLEVWERSGGGRGGPGSPGPRLRNDKPLTQLAVEVRKGQSRPIGLISVATGTVQLAVRRSDATAITRATVQFVLAAEAGDAAPDAWSKLPSHRSISVRSGDSPLGEVPAGAWVWHVGVTGTAGLRGTLSVGAGGAFRIEGELAPPAPGQGSPR